MTRRAPLRLLALLGLIALPVGAAGCGKKGPPLPPLVRIPAAPADVVASRRGNAVDVAFTVPGANTDGSRPANVQRVEVYALDGAEPASENVVMVSGVRIGSVDVKAPRDPNATVDAEDPDSDVEPLVGPGLDQGSVAHLHETLHADSGAGAVTRTYVGVGITTRGRRGLLSKPVAVTLAAPPPPPSEPRLTYDETAVTLAWTAPAATTAQGAEGPRLAYAVYDVSPPVPGATPEVAARGDRRLNGDLLETTTYADPLVTWNTERCYVLRAVHVVGGLPVEGDASPTACVTLVDTFPPAAPTGVTAVAATGSINLIWTPSTASDLAGYRVLRAEEPATELRPIAPQLLTQTTFSDTVQPGVRYTYAVQAVDAAGNASAASATVEETAR